MKTQLIAPPVTASPWQVWPTHWAGGSDSCKLDGYNTCWIQSDDFGEVCRMAPSLRGDYRMPDEETYRRAHRIAQCVNACAGIPEPETALPAVLKALEMDREALLAARSLTGTAAFDVAIETNLEALKLAGYTES